MAPLSETPLGGNGAYLSPKAVSSSCSFSSSKNQAKIEDENEDEDKITLRKRHLEQGNGGRSGTRTPDLLGVNETRYHCAKRPLMPDFIERNALFNEKKLLAAIPTRLIQERRLFQIYFRSR